jgi:hypothetical protein
MFTPNQIKAVQTKRAINTTKINNIVKTSDNAVSMIKTISYTVLVSPVIIAVMAFVCFVK